MGAARPFVNKDEVEVGERPDGSAEAERAAKGEKGQRCQVKMLLPSVFT